MQDGSKRRGVLGLLLNYYTAGLQIGNTAHGSFPDSHLAQLLSGSFEELFASQSWIWEIS